MDFKQTSGIPRPVDDLPAGTISVRVIRGDLSNPIVNHPVELRVGDDARTQNTDAEGRAEFIVATTGTVRASTVVDGERLESQAFPAPGQAPFACCSWRPTRKRPRARPRQPGTR